MGTRGGATGVRLGHPVDAGRGRARRFAVRPAPRSHCVSRSGFHSFAGLLRVADAHARTLRLQCVASGDSARLVSAALSHRVARAYADALRESLLFALLFARDGREDPRRRSAGFDSVVESSDGAAQLRHILLCRIYSVSYTHLTLPTIYSV